ncbi:pimeloyl-ACP methyl ester esterase BioH [Candidatus Pantoea edessiphila]|uniref:pimeloyl-ACP methyl ester esterase BioH n=1 Tax=Candidatus Pantoea edessiphila TaxID=2044610 RepID=UPI001F53F3F4|nr:pimeloyl-ACP methyl ester esterase BioH [Candidatus Pantoea edessiphila]
MYWYTCGKGNIDLVLIHGWALNSEVWNCIIPFLRKKFRLHLVDLPGYGRSQSFNNLNLNDLAKSLIPFIPPKAVLIGWSLGGLVAMKLALIESINLGGIITVSSSPKFIATDSWPGIKLEVLQNFQYYFQKNLKRSVERFLILQTSSSKQLNLDILKLKKAIFTQPIPSSEVLNDGLKILIVTDMRKELVSIKIPFLRIYGALDSLVPRDIVPMIDKLIPASSSMIIKKAAHAPFVSHPDTFCKYISEFLI